MSKKSKNRQKRQQKAQIIHAAMTKDTTNETTMVNEGTPQAEDLVKSVVGKKEVAPAAGKNIHETSDVIREIKKIGIVFGLIIIFLVVIKFLDNKYEIVVKLADVLSGLLK